MTINITKDESIITQVAAKIAGDIVAAGYDGATLDTALVNFQTAFDKVRTELFVAHGDASAASFAAQFPNTRTLELQERVIEHVSQQPMQQQTLLPSTPTTVGLVIAGTQHGDLPPWLAADCARAGVGRVWDNRDKLNENPKRPWFKQADAQNGTEPVAFWPPKTGGGR